MRKVRKEAVDDPKALPFLPQRFLRRIRWKIPIDRKNDLMFSAGSSVSTQQKSKLMNCLAVSLNGKLISSLMDDHRTISSDDQSKSSLNSPSKAREAAGGGNVSTITSLQISTLEPPSKNSKL